MLSFRVGLTLLLIFVVSLYLLHYVTLEVNLPYLRIERRRIPLYVAVVNHYSLLDVTFRNMKRSRYQYVATVVDNTGCNLMRKKFPTRFNSSVWEGSFSESFNCCAWQAWKLRQQSEAGCRFITSSVPFNFGQTMNVMRYDALEQGFDVFVHIHSDALVTNPKPFDDIVGVIDQVSNVTWGFLPIAKFYDIFCAYHARNLQRFAGDFDPWMWYVGDLDYYNRVVRAGLTTVDAYMSSCEHISHGDPHAGGGSQTISQDSRLRERINLLQPLWGEYFHRKQHRLAGLEVSNDNLFPNDYWITANLRPSSSFSPSLFLAQVTALGKAMSARFLRLRINDGVFAVAVFQFVDPSTHDSTTELVRGVSYLVANLTQAPEVRDRLLLSEEAIVRRGFMRF